MLLLLCLALTTAFAEAYHGPLDFNCTSPALNVTWPAAPNLATCGEKMHKTSPGLATHPAVAASVLCATSSSCSSVDDDKGYLLAMIDPDAPSFASPSYSPIRHWLVVSTQEPPPQLDFPEVPLTDCLRFSG